jgi:hypothetical protein
VFGSTQLQLPCNKTVVWGNFNLVHIVCEMAHQQVASHLQFVLLMCLCVQLLVLIKKFVVAMLIMMLYASIVGTCTREHLLSVSSSSSFFADRCFLQPLRGFDASKMHTSN